MNIHLYNEVVLLSIGHYLKSATVSNTVYEITEGDAGGAFERACAADGSGLSDHPGWDLRWRTCARSAHHPGRIGGAPERLPAAGAPGAPAAEIPRLRRRHPPPRCRRVASRSGLRRAPL